MGVSLGGSVALNCGHPTAWFGESTDSHQHIAIDSMSPVRTTNRR